jgi:DNA-directed RNA polymerase specialized sigma24 family protein
MNDFRNFDPNSEDFFKSLFVRRLRAVAKSLFEGKNYGDYSPEDLLSDTLQVYCDEKWWERKDIRNVNAYAVSAMRHIFLKKLPELKKFHSGKEVDQDTLPSPDSLEKTRERLETKSIVKALKSYFPDDKQVRIYIELKYGQGLKRSEIANVMGVEPREVTDFERRLRYRIPDSVLLKLIGYRDGR